MKIEAKIFGATVVKASMNRAGFAAEHAMPALLNVARYIYYVEATIFQSQGRRGGGSWKKLSPEWSFRKRVASLDPRIMIATGDLLKAMTQHGAAHQIFQVDDGQLVMGTTLPYAHRHQYGRGGMPRRSFVKITVQDRDNMRGIVRRHIMDAFKPGYRPPRLNA